MHIHILGICGTFMGGIAQLAAALGHRVSGSDLNVYPPMSDHLAAAGIDILNGFDPQHLQPAPDLVLIGNALSRGNAAVEYVLNEHIPYDSGPAWLAREILADRKVLAISGTHGKTTTTSMLAWILEHAGLAPGYLIGGLAKNFAYTAALGDGQYFVIEADEYDTAFFDKRSKFIHYRPDILVINNLEYDHADIFPDLASIQRQFHHVIRTVPGGGQIIVGANDSNVDEALALGCWSPVSRFGFASEANWRLQGDSENSRQYDLTCPNGQSYALSPPGLGNHNALNAVAAISAAAGIGIDPAAAIAALNSFSGVKRRLETIAEIGNVTIYDDFAHHPTAVKETLTAMQTLRSPGRIHCVLEPRSNTMQLGVHKDELISALAGADRIYLYQGPAVAWDMSELAKRVGQHCRIYRSVDDIVTDTVAAVRPHDHVVIMSNGGFEHIHEKMVKALKRAQG